MLFLTDRFDILAFEPLKLLIFAIVPLIVLNPPVKARTLTLDTLLALTVELFKVERFNGSLT